MAHFMAHVDHKGLGLEKPGYNVYHLEPDCLSPVPNDILIRFFNILFFGTIAQA